MNSGFKHSVWILNTIGLVIYLFWLYSMSDQEILRAQGGIIYFVPIIPFFFVYLLLIPPKPPVKAEEKKQMEEPAAREPEAPPSSR